MFNALDPRSPHSSRHSKRSYCDILHRPYPLPHVAWELRHPDADLFDAKVIESRANYCIIQPCLRLQLAVNKVGSFRDVLGQWKWTMSRNKLFEAYVAIGVENCHFCPPIDFYDKR